jgi:nicotinamide-nucleotide amidase
MPTIQLLLTGDELMAGNTVDSNSAMIAQQLEQLGLSLHRKVTTGDELDVLIAEIKQLSRDADLLIINGGLGPTVDDLTAQALATATGSQLVEHADAMTHLSAWCKERGLLLNDANRKQAWLPENSRIVPNPVGSAVGFSCQHNDCLVICTPGVPNELRAMMERHILPMVEQQFPAVEKRQRIRLQTFGIGESSLQQRVNDLTQPWPKSVELGFRAGMPQLEIKLTASSSEQEAIAQCRATLEALMGDYIIGEDDATLASCVLEMLTASGLKLTTAESCTGGLIASQLTSISGASNAFEAGFVTYSNAMKTAMLGVPATTLAQQGAVSEAVVMAMATGALETSAADLAIAVSGVAGPDGGTESKPVGTVWIAWGRREKLQTVRLQLPGKRQWFQQMVAAISLDLIRRELSGVKGLPRYFSRFS